ncbi:transposase [Streptomyces sp. QTS137]
MRPGGCPAGSATAGRALPAVPDAGRPAQVDPADGRASAGRLPGGTTQALRQFVNQSPREWTPARQRIARRSGEAGEAGRPEVRVVDDGPFPRCGTTSAGVVRQCRGVPGERATGRGAVGVRGHRHRRWSTPPAPLPVAFSRSPGGVPLGGTGESWDAPIQLPQI